MASAPPPPPNVSVPTSPSATRNTQPLQLSGALDHYEHFDLTPVIGREFAKEAKLAEFLTAPNSDELLRELAITISRRGVVFFRAQDDLTNEMQKKLVLRLGELSGRPSTSTLHIHPIFNSEREDGGDDPQISTISSVQRSKIYKPSSNSTSTGAADTTLCTKKQRRAEWHSDISFEPVPADYTALRLVEFPDTGGDTLFASGCELYDMLSPPYQAFLSGLSVTFEQPDSRAIAARDGFALYDKPRGSPQNFGTELRAVHPFVRSNPVTGWRSIFPIGSSVSHVDGVTSEESRALLEWVLDLLQRNHDLQVRFKWRNPNDVAIWDNRSVFHTATFDYAGLGPRLGYRVVGVGEKPYLDPASTSRRADLGQDVPSL